MWNELKKFAQNKNILYNQLVQLKQQMASKAQEIYDSWQQDEEGVDLEHGGGGICDEIQREISGIIAENIADVELIDGGQDGDDHAFVIAYNDNEAYEIDIPYWLYESGGGYSWNKIPGVKFNENSVVISSVNRYDIVPDND